MRNNSGLRILSDKGKSATQYIVNHERDNSTGRLMSVKTFKTAFNIAK